MEKTLEFKWTVSRGRDTYGYNICTLRVDGKSFGLERYQSFYSASSRVPTKKHTVPLLDGACGFSSMERIKKILEQLENGLITLEEFNTTLDAQGIRGAIRNNGGYIGYDYTNQEWIDIK